MTTKRPATDSQLRHCFHRDGNGNVHVDTFIDDKRWQHHVHSAVAFAGWSELMAGKLIGLPDGDCSCDLLPGQVLERDGRIWNHPEFASSRRGLMWKFLSFIIGKEREQVPQT